VFAFGVLVLEVVVDITRHAAQLDGAVLVAVAVLELA
jgi:hypothetical protein